MKPDRSKLTPEQLDKLDQWEATNKQLDLLQKLADKEPMSLGEAEKLLRDIKTELARIGDKKPPDVNMNVDLANFTNPLKDALETSSTALVKAIGGIKPTANVEAPKVTVKPADVQIDLDKVVRAIKASRVELPAFPQSLGSEGDIYIDGQAYTPRSAAVIVMERGQNPVVPAKKGQRIRLISCFIMAGDFTSMEFMGDGYLSGPIPLRPHVGFVLSENRSGWTTTQPGEALLIQQHQLATLGGMLTYVLI